MARVAREPLVGRVREAAMLEHAHPFVPGRQLGMPMQLLQQLARPCRRNTAVGIMRQRVVEHMQPRAQRTEPLARVRLARRAAQRIRHIVV